MLWMVVIFWERYRNSIFLICVLFLFLGVGICVCIFVKFGIKYFFLLFICRVDFGILILVIGLSFWIFLFFIKIVWLGIRLLLFIGNILMLIKVIILVVFIFCVDSWVREKKSKVSKVLSCNCFIFGYYVEYYYNI